MKKLLPIVSLLLTGCGVNFVAVGEALQNTEQALCPLQTARNVDQTLDNVLGLVPLIAWEPVCQEAESGN